MHAVCPQPAPFNIFSCLSLCCRKTPFLERWVLTSREAPRTEFSSPPAGQGREVQSRLGMAGGESGLQSGEAKRAGGFNIRSTASSPLEMAADCGAIKLE